MASRTCRCNSVVGRRLIRQITPRLRALNIFDIGNVFVYCLYVQKNNQGQKNINIYQVYGSPVVPSAGIYLVVGDSVKMGCNSNIIYIGKSEVLFRRICFLILELAEKAKNLHSDEIKNKLNGVLNQYSRAYLYIIGFPLLANIPPQINRVITQIRNKAKRKKLSLEEIVEACFLDTYDSHYNGLPCCVKQHPSEKLIKYIFQYIFNIFNSPQAQQYILNILQNINSTFQNCIQNC